MKHKINNPNPETMRGDCNTCGSVRIYYRNRLRGTFRCSQLILQQKRLGYYHGLPPKNKCCEICGEEKALFIDHDHSTKKFRGWLCRRCNALLGFAKDDPDILQRAIAYLKSK